MKHITSRQNAVVPRFRSVAEGADRVHVLLDGLHLVTDALAAHFALTEAVVARDALDRADVAAIVDRLQGHGVTISSAAPQVMSAISPVRSASPIVALGVRPSRSVDGTVGQFFPTHASPSASRLESSALTVCAIDVQDPGNIGAMTRVAEAGGATLLAVAGRSADPYGWKAVRGSMGSVFRLPLLYPCDATAFVSSATQHGYRIIATIPRGGKPPEAVDLRGPVAILVGGEGAGLPPALVAVADERLSIPMTPPVESLNAATCTALVVYEARRQRACAHRIPDDRREPVPNV